MKKYIFFQTFVSLVNSQIANVVTALNQLNKMHLRTRCFVLTGPSNDVGLLV